MSGDLGYGDEVGGILHAGCILSGAKDCNSIGGSTECFDALVCLLAIVEARTHAMDAKVWIGDENRFTPFSSLRRILRLNMTSDWEHSGQSGSGRSKVTDLL